MSEATQPNHEPRPNAVNLRASDDLSRWLISSPRTPKVSMHPRAMLDHASCLELDWLEAAYGSAATHTAGRYLMRLAFVVFLAVLVLGGGIVLAHIVLEFVGLTHRLSAVVVVGFTAVFMAWAYGSMWRDWRAQEPISAESDTREACWALLVQFLGRCAPHTPEHARAELEIERLDASGWAWRLIVPVAPYRDADVALIDAKGGADPLYTCTLTLPPDTPATPESPPALPVASLWPRDGASVDAPTLADHVCAALYPDAVARVEVAPHARLSSDHTDPPATALDTDASWTLYAYARSGSVPIVQPAHTLRDQKTTQKRLQRVLRATGLLLLHAAAAVFVSLVATRFDDFNTDALIAGWVLVLMCPLALFASDWGVGFRLMPRQTLRRVREAPAPTTHAALVLRGGVLSLGDAQIELERPFQASLTQDPTAPEARPRLGVVLTQGQGAQSARLSFVCEAAPSPELSALPRLASNAPVIASDDLINGLWPALAAHAAAHGEPLPELRLEVEA